MLTIASIVQNRLNKTLAYHKLTLSTFNVLHVLSDGISKPVTQLGNELITQAPGTTKLVDGLEKLGLVMTARTHKDRRRVMVTITDQGVDVLTKAIGQCRQIETALADLVGKEVLTEFVTNGLAINN